MDDISHPQVAISVRTSYEGVLELLEGAYAKAQERFPNYGDEFRQAWADARGIILGSHGWAEREFYAEMDARRRASFFKKG